MADATIQRELARATALLHQGRIADAETIANLALKRAGGGNNPDALRILATAAVQRGRLDDARAHFERLTQASPRDAAAHVNLGRVRLGLGNAAGAIESFERALALQPDMPTALASLADALNRLGRRDEARGLLQACADRDDADPEVALQLATVLDQLGEHARAADIAGRNFDAARTAKIDPVLCRQLGFALSRSLDALDQVDRAFAAAAQANAITIPGARFDPADFRAAIDAQIDFFTPRRLHAIQRSVERSPLPVFVTGVARSGTTLVEQIIHSHPQGFGAGELTLIDDLADTIQTQLDSPMLYPQCLLDLRADTATALSQAHVRQLQGLVPASRSRSQPALRIVDKSLRAVMHLGLIHAILPGATVIHCRRDPLANGLSCFMSALSPIKHPWASDLAHIGLVLRETDRLMQHWRSALDLPILDVHYEGLVADQDRISRAIIAHIDLEWDERCLRYYESDRIVRTLSYDQVRRPIYAEAVDRHERYAKFLQPLRASRGGQT